LDPNDIVLTLAPELSKYPGILQEPLSAKVLSLARENAALLSFSQAQTAKIVRAIAVSDFLYRTMLKFLQSQGVRTTDGPAELAEWLVSSRFEKQGQISKALLQKELADWLENIKDSAGLEKALRDFRRKHLFAIVFRDLVLHESFQVTAREVSWLAEVCIDGALSWHHQELSRQFGYPVDGQGNHQQMAVLGMGKLGAGELNVSSDIDLIFAFPESGSTVGGKRSLDNQSYFARLGQRLIQALDKVTADGFVFRVDMRLRPYGQSGALVLSFAAMEEYYADQGRDWERYAMIKAAPVAGDKANGAQLLTSLRPFVYRRYVDFGVIDALRVMKEMIVRDVRRKGMNQNIKIGDGGIREVEFIVQAFQLIRGGRTPELQQRALLDILPVLGQQQLLPQAAVDQLRGAYIFLRNLEHAIQGLDDKQTQLIPDNELSRTRIALAMGYSHWSECSATLEHHRKLVAGHFADVVSEAAEGKDEDETAPLWRQLWLARIAPDQLAALFPCCAQQDIDSALQQLVAFRANPRIFQLQAQGRERLDQFIPRMLEEFAVQQGNGETFARLLRFVESVARRSAYLALLNENPEALKELIHLFAASSWIAEQIIATPVLLDELLHSESLYTPPDMATLKSELQQQMLGISEDDLEAQLEALRYFKKAHVLRVAASEVRGTLPLMKVSDYLTFIAETILSQVFELAWNAVSARYGVPVDDNNLLCNKDFGIIGYGKLGGIELGYGSDLDLVFLHDSSANGETNGDKSINNQVFFTRLGQKIINILTTKTLSGDIYEVDMRLRPSGNSGLLVSSVNAFRQYQLENAWTWEHQALVRARFICGSSHIQKKFTEVRLQVLTTKRDCSELRRDVLAMRAKMRESLATRPEHAESPHGFDLKQDAGGIVDIEFMVQYAALRWSSTYPEVVVWSDNIRILETLASKGLVSSEEANDLCEIYRSFRSRGHLLALQNRPAKVDSEDFVSQRNKVTALWQRLFDL